MDQTPVQTVETLAELVKKLHEIFSADKVNVEEVQNLMGSYKSNPVEWSKYAKLDKYRYTRNLVDEGNGKFNLMILCWGEGHGSSIHDHTDSHCFLKLLQGQLKETLFNWPDVKSKSQEMSKKWEKTLQENQCTYINGKISSMIKKKKKSPYLCCLLFVTLWNSIPHSLCLAPSLASFKTRLKTLLFDRAFSHPPTPTIPALHAS
uniref:Cysteine dioxygenase n=1 Tax=Callorhinchus milii TaxID=7868 RepID=A0A4W3JV07_CALMI